MCVLVPLRSPFCLFYVRVIEEAGKKKDKYYGIDYGRSGQGGGVLYLLISVFPSVLGCIGTCASLLRFYRYDPCFSLR